MAGFDAWRPIQVATPPEQWSLPEDAKNVLRERFTDLRDTVALEVFTKPGENDLYNTLSKRFTEELATLSDKITVTFHAIGSEVATRREVHHSPTILIQPSKYDIRYLGAPFGEEGRSFIEAVLLVSRNESMLSALSLKVLDKLTEPRDVKVFVTLVCPYCPGQVLNAIKAAIYKPGLVSSSCIDVAEFPDLNAKYRVNSVPLTVINDATISTGYEPEERFVAQLVTLEPLPAQELAPSSQETVEVDILIIGGGPAGLTAGLYAARSGLHTIVLEKSAIGGQVAITPVVENWPGYKTIPGRELMELITTQVRGYLPVAEGEEVVELKVGKRIEAMTTRHRYLAKALILATGAYHRKLKVPGEDRFAGHGVSYCATCDGFFYKGKTVAVVGGGNTACTDALYLKNLGATPTIVVRSGKLSAEAALQRTVEREKIPIRYHAVVQEITGTEQVSGLVLKDARSGQTDTLPVDGVFVAIGEVPNTKLATDIGLSLSQDGYLATDRFGRTNIPRIYAAGDVTGGVRQIVTAVGSGASAAVTAFQDLSHPYWIPKEKPS